MLRYLFILSLVTSASLLGYASEVDEKLEKAIIKVLETRPDLIRKAIESSPQGQDFFSKKQYGSAYPKFARFQESRYNPVIGEKNAPKSVLVFIDYRCRSCVKGLSLFESYVKKQPLVKFILRDLPILGKPSEDLALISQRAHLQGKHLAFREYVLNNTDLSDIAQKLGITEGDTAMESSIQRTLYKTRRIARKLNIQGTPALIIDGKLITGLPEEAELTEKLFGPGKNSEKNEK